MRIISILVTLAVSWVMILPQSALAEGGMADETNTQLQIKSEVVLIDGIVSQKVKLIPYNFPGYEPVKAFYEEVEKEAEREKKLARFKEKLNKAVFPKGKFTINASAYTAAADECGKSDGITASGVKVKEKRTIACPPQFPFGTKIKIDGYGTYTCEDRGGAIKGNHIDIYMTTKTQAFAFGRRNLLAEVVK